MNKMEMVKCDECDHIFSLSKGKGKLRERTYPKGIKKYYFICPNCKKEYISYWTNPSIRRKQKKINDTWAVLKRDALTMSTPVAEQYYKVIEDTKKEIQEQMKVLKDKMGVRYG